MAKPRAGMTKQKLKAADLLGRGDMTDRAICEQVGISVVTLWHWEKQDDFITAVLAASDRHLAGYVPKARGVLMKQAEDDKLPWLAHNAANSILREHVSSRGTQAQQVIVTFGDSAVTPGVPAVDEVSLDEE